MTIVTSDKVKKYLNGFASTPMTNSEGCMDDHRLFLTKSKKYLNGFASSPMTNSEGYLDDHRLLSTKSKRYLDGFCGNEYAASNPHAF